MASATENVSAPSLLSKGDYVNASGRTCFIQDIQNNLGFNVYICVEMDSGVILRKSHYEIDKVHIEMVDLPDNFFQQPQAEVSEPEVPENDFEQTEEESKRFQHMSDQDLDTLAENRNSHLTRKQTSWAIKIFRGRSI